MRRLWFQCIDFIFLKLFHSTVFSKLGLDYWLSDAIWKSATTLDLDFTIKYHGTRIPMMKGKLEATVKSGHPLHTTFGNGLRVL